nr:immunoglobulin heavy chain junction region [Mus musculus]
ITVQGTTVVATAILWT